MTGPASRITAAWAWAVEAKASKAEAFADWYEAEGDRWLAFAWVPVRQDGIRRPTPAKCLSRARTYHWRAACARRSAVELRGFVAAAPRATP